MIKIIYLLFYGIVIPFLLLCCYILIDFTINISTNSNNIKVIYTEDYNITDNNNYACELGVLYYVNNPYYNINKELVSCEELVIEDNEYRFSSYNKLECLEPK